MVRTLLNSLSESLDVSSKLVDKTEHTPSVTKEITKESLLDICARSGCLFSDRSEDFDIVRKCFLNVFDNLHTVESIIDSSGHWFSVENEVELLKRLFLSIAYLGISYSVVLRPSLVDPIALLAAQSDCHKAVVSRLLVQIFVCVTLGICHIFMLIY